jgi:hypothetical protein
MSTIRDWAADVDLAEFLGVGLDTRQIGYLAAALFLALFGLSALRRVRQAGGPWPVVWIALAVGLILGAFLVVAHGFPDRIPDELRPWIDSDRLLRAGAIVSLLGCSIVFLSAYWLRNPLPRLTLRAVGLALSGAALWLAADWFGDQLPDEARPWAARAVVTRALAVLGLLFVTGTCWVRLPGEALHKRWANRILAVPAGGAAVLFAVRWFGSSVWPDLPADDVGRVTIILAAVGTGTCALIAAGAYLLRDRSKHPRRQPSEARPPNPRQPLPVAVLLDDHGRPVVPAQVPQAGSTGA